MEREACDRGAAASTSCASTDGRPSSSWTCPAPPAKRSSSTVTATSSPRWSAGRTVSGPGSRCARATGSSAAVSATTATPRSRRSARSRRSRRRGSPTRDASCSSRPARKAAATTCPFYMDALAARIGTPGLVVCLDSGLRHLRPTLGHDLAARHRQRRADRGSAERRRPFRRGQRHRPQ